ncbi:porin family protein [Luteimonas yindakuii]|uniref:Porin family protein n=1 Tax=Luteimonas yindakuii TaxID=2565782 RepID=A0A4Z1RIT1_9GAMM|nr:porin family protein [Luteimonas yindakuii]TKS54627.1 porin family protein [Luteimonas yindakuii]
MIRELLLATAVTVAAAPAIAGPGAGFLAIEAGRSDLSVEGAKDNDTAAGLRGGYYFRPQFGIEGFVTRYGADTSGPWRTEVDGIGVGVFGKANFGAEAYTGFYVSGRAGIAHNRVEETLRGVDSWDDTDTNPYVGVGLGFDYSPNFGVGVRYDYQEPKVGDVRVKLETLTGSVEYRF